MVDIPAALRELVDGGPLAHVTTINPDGSPHVTVVWTGWDGDDLVSGHMGPVKKIRNVRRDPRAAVSLEGPRVPGVFLAEYAVLTVSVTVEEGGAWDLLDRLTKVYIGPGVQFPAPKMEGGYVLRYSVQRISGIGPWMPGPAYGG